jgi:hypothetical protein
MTDIFPYKKSEEFGKHRILVKKYNGPRRLNAKPACIYVVTKFPKQNIVVHTRNT